MIDRPNERPDERPLDRQVRAPGAGESAAWKRNLAIIGHALGSGDGEGSARAAAIAGELEQCLGQLTEHRRLKALRSEAGVAPTELAWLDRLIAQKKQRRLQLEKVREAEPQRLAAQRLAPGVAATPEARARPARRDPLLALAEAGRLDLDQVRAGLEIRDIYEGLSRGLGARTLVLASAGNAVPWRQPEMPAFLSAARRNRFLPWAAHWRASDGATLDIVLKLAVFGLSVYALSRRHRMSWRHCLEKLSAGLDLYWEFGPPPASTGDNPGIPRRGCP